MIAVRRSTAMSIRLLELSPLSLPFKALSITMKNYRDEMVRNDTIAHLSAQMSQLPFTAPVINAKALTPSAVPQHRVTKQSVAEAATGHTLKNVKDEYFSEKKRDWTEQTLKEKEYGLDMFSSFCATHNVFIIEEVNKQTISDFKMFLDTKYPSAVSSRKKRLDNVNALFSFCCDQRDYLTRNPVKGMGYKNVKTVNKKEAVTREQYDTLLSLPIIQTDQKSKFILAMFYHTGMRLGELAQITSSDFREIEGIKCISINDENGKKVKNESSIRNIPLNDALLELGIWEEKPALGMTSQQIDVALRKMFKMISIKRTSHCMRYSLSDRLRDHNVQDSTRAFILGHTQSLITDRVYATRSPLLQMKAALDLASKGSNMTGSV
ncbi:site-specific integrase [Scandinavium manionii]|uniref:site-specific integrase n=1 Tax=Scandinavium manionii TaxID=2926520 RepID=UPI002165CD60|nr:site-specific integrase [Scandinavium manionii]